MVDDAGVRAPRAARRDESSSTETREARGAARGPQPSTEERGTFHIIRLPTTEFPDVRSRAMLLPLLPSAAAHFPLANGASYGSRWSTLATAMPVEDITRSQSASRISFCDTPYFWFTFNAPASFTRLMVGGTVPVLERFWSIRVAVALLGPGLPTAGVTRLPAEVASQVPAGYGALLVAGRPDQSRCDWMEDPLSRRAYNAQPGSAVRTAGTWNT